MAPANKDDATAMQHDDALSQHKEDVVKQVSFTRDDNSSDNNNHHHHHGGGQSDRRMSSHHNSHGQNGHGSSSLTEQMPWYTPPMQRQRWGEEQLHPHTDWGDIFFDLFYVASAYNLGNLLREDPTARGLLYLCGCFLPLMNCWTFKMYFDSRYYILQQDVFHQCYYMASLLTVATAALHIRPVAILSNPHEYDMFAFSLSVCCGNLLCMGRLLEVALCQRIFQTKGLYPEALLAVRRDFLNSAVYVIANMAAVIYSGVQFFGHEKEDENSGYASSYYGGDGYPDDGYTKNEEKETSDAAHRVLAGGDETSYNSSAKGEQDDVAIWLLLGGFLVGLLVMCLSVFFNTGGDRKKSTVPMNIGYAIHRYGELVMLLLGESVLSLLIVDLNEGYEYYKTFFAGVITVILLQYLHFESHSHDPDKHAMRRSIYSGMTYYVLQFVYAPALIILGTCYKMFLLEFEYADYYEYEDGDGEDKSGGRMLIQVLFSSLQRSLAGGTSAALRFSTEERQQRIAYFFSGSLATVWLCLDLMILAHRGLRDNLKRCRETETLQVGAIVMVVLRVGLIAFAATLCLYVTDPVHLSFAGMAGIIGQLFLRAFGTFFLPADKRDEEEREAEALERVTATFAARLRDDSN